MNNFKHEWSRGLAFPDARSMAEYFYACGAGDIQRKLDEIKPLANCSKRVQRAAMEASNEIRKALDKLFKDTSPATPDLPPAAGPNETVIVYSHVSKCANCGQVTSGHDARCRLCDKPMVNGFWQPDEDE